MFYSKLQSHFPENKWNNYISDLLSSWRTLNLSLFEENAWEYQASSKMEIWSHNYSGTIIVGHAFLSIENFCLKRIKGSYQTSIRYEKE